MNQLHVKIGETTCNQLCNFSILILYYFIIRRNEFECKTSGISNEKSRYDLRPINVTDLI